MPIPLALAILDFAALLALAFAGARFGYRAASAALGVFACVVLAWGVLAWLATTLLVPLPPVR